MNTYKVVFSTFAQQDLTEIITYHTEINKKYATSLYQIIKSRIKDLSCMPKKGMVVPELERLGITKYRQLLEQKYRIIYRVSDKHIEVLLIVDSRRNLADLLIKKLMKINEM